MYILILKIYDFVTKRTGTDVTCDKKNRYRCHYPCSSTFILFNIFFSILDTWTWDIPKTLATWAWVWSLKYLSRIICLSLGSSSFINLVSVILLVIRFASSLFEDNVSNILIVLSSLLFLYRFSSIELMGWLLSRANVISSLEVFNILDISPHARFSSFFYDVFFLDFFYSSRQIF